MSRMDSQLELGLCFAELSKRREKTKGPRICARVTITAGQKLELD